MSGSLNLFTSALIISMCYASAFPSSRFFPSFLLSASTVGLLLIHRDIEISRERERERERREKEQNRPGGRWAEVYRYVFERRLK